MYAHLDNDINYGIIYLVSYTFGTMFTGYESKLKNYIVYV